MITQEYVDALKQAAHANTRNYLRAETFLSVAFDMIDDLAQQVAGYGVATDWPAVKDEVYARVYRKRVESGLSMEGLPEPQ